jgi:hypothetical protein
MRFRNSAVVVLLCFAVMGGAVGVARSWAAAGDASKASAGPQYNTGQTNITCSSNDGNRKYCGKYNPSQVSLSKQISGSPCVQGKSWGVDGNGLWVDRGCRATFTIYGNSNGGGSGVPGGGWWQPAPGDTWPPKDNWHGGNWGSGGACFYKSSNFTGDFFCMRRGEQNASLTGGYGDQVSSIRIFGGARVYIYDDRNFSGPRLLLNRDAADLKRYSVAEKPGHSWNNRINSVRIQ